MKRTELISVVIPNQDGEAVLEPCLDSLRSQTYSQLEVLLVDGQSRDSSVIVSRNCLPDIKVISVPPFSGFSLPVNTGIRNSSGDLVLVLNNDVVLSDSYISRLYDTIGAHPKIAAVQGVILNNDKKDLIDDAGDFFTRSCRVFQFGKGMNVADLPKFDARRIFSCSGTAVLYRKEVLNKIGLFDEDFYFYLEDVDVGFRLNMEGFHGYLCNGAYAYHRGGFTTDKMKSKTIRYSMRNNILIVVKNYPRKMLMLNLFRVVFGLMRMSLVYGIKKKEPAATIRGVFDAIVQLPNFMSKRKRYGPLSVGDTFRFMEDSERKTEE